MMPDAARCLLAGLLVAWAAADPLLVRCGEDCTEALSSALASSAAHVLILPPSAGIAASVGSAARLTRLTANGTDRLIEFGPGLKLVGFLNYTSDYSPALVRLDVSRALNVSLVGQGAVLQHITLNVGGDSDGVHLEGLNIVDPGWDGLYVRGVRGLTVKNCVFDRPYRNGISVIDAADVLVEDSTFSNSLPNGTGRVSPMAGVDLEPNRHTDRLQNITFRRCRSLNNSGAGFQILPGNLNASSADVSIRFEFCDVEGVGIKPLMHPNVPDGYYFTGFGGNGAGGSIHVLGGTVRGTASFGAAVYSHGVNDPHIEFEAVLFDRVAVHPGTFDAKYNFTNGPLVIASLGSGHHHHPLGGVTFKHITVIDEQPRPALLVDGSGSMGAANIEGTIAVCTTHEAEACNIAAGGWKANATKEAQVGLKANITIFCQPICANVPSAKLFV